MPEMDNVESLDDLLKNVREWSQAEESEQGQPRHRSEIEAETSVFRCSSHPDTGQGDGGFGFLSYKIWVLGGFKL